MPADELRAESEAVTYCAVGIRSSPAWFDLKYLLGFSNVRNYDGSWNEWSQSEEAHVLPAREAAR